MHSGASWCIFYQVQNSDIVVLIEGFRVRLRKARAWNGNQFDLKHQISFKRSLIDRKKDVWSLSGRPTEQKPVKIRVKTTIWNNDEKETFELTTFGRYYEKNDSLFLQYQEVMEEGDIKSIVKVSQKDALILRSGAINMRMVFENNKKHAGRYETPFGTMGITTRTKRLEHKIEANQGEIDILYDLNMQGEHAGTYHLVLTFEEEKK